MMQMASETRVRGAHSVWKALTRTSGGKQQHVAAQAAVAAPTVVEKEKGRVNEQNGRIDSNSRGGRNVVTEGGGGGEKLAGDRERVDFGFNRQPVRTKYVVKREIARGGNGVVFLVQDVKSGQEWAMKSIPKVLDGEGVSERKRLDHAQAVKREVEVMKRLSGCLNVASLEEVFEDDDHVHIIMEYCSGGELHHRIGNAHYSEQTVASFMRATLRTLAQCHANGILHRDIKPGNFLLSSEKGDAPLKAVDFGLAVFHDGKKPRTDLGLEGTPWFMAPETLQSEVYASSDIWSAGVMAYQLLTGKFPFNDKTSPFNPSLTKVWKSILMDDAKMSGARWDGISDEAKEFVRMLLNKDHSKRPTAKEALKHPWLRGTIKDRSKGSQISLAVVQRIQRYSQSSIFKRSVLELIAEDLLNDIDESAPGCDLGTDGRPLIEHPLASPLEYLYEKLCIVDRSLVDRPVLAQGLRDMGYRLSDEEVDRLLDQLDVGLTGQVGKAQLAASQIDWRYMQENNTEKWLKHARRVFSDLDADKDGVLSSEDILALLKHKLPPSEVEGALSHALAEAARRRETNEPSQHGSVGDDSSHGGSQVDRSLRDGMNFRQFIRMLHPGSYDSLEMYDERLGSPEAIGLQSATSHDDMDKLLEKSVKGAQNFSPNSELFPLME